MKTQMQLANRAWRIETRSLGWKSGWKHGRKEWKAFCRENAEVTVKEGGEHFHSQEEANQAVIDELSDWGQ